MRAGARGEQHPPEIGKVNMDGSFRHYIIKNTKIVSPQSLTLDYVNKRLFWTDAHMDHIESIDYNGQYR